MRTYDLEEGQKECQGECAKCGSGNVEYGSMQVDGECVWYEYECGDCGDCGEEHYVLEYCYSSTLDMDFIERKILTKTK